MTNCGMEDMNALCEWTLKSETVTDYFYDIMDLCDKSDPGILEETRTDFLQNGLPALSLISRVPGFHSNSMTDCHLEVCI